MQRSLKVCHLPLAFKFSAMLLLLSAAPLLATVGKAVTPPAPSYAFDKCRQPAVVTSVVASSAQLYAAVRNNGVQCIRVKMGTYQLGEPTWKNNYTNGLWLNRSLSIVADIDGSRPVLNTPTTAAFDGGQPLVVSKLSSVYVSGLQFTGGRKTGGAGIWVDQGARLTAHNVTVFNNTADSEGGGVYVDHNSELELYDVRVRVENFDPVSGSCSEVSDPVPADPLSMFIHRLRFTVIMLTTGLAATDCTSKARRPSSTQAFTTMGTRSNHVMAAVTVVG